MIKKLKLAIMALFLLLGMQSLHAQKGRQAVGMDLSAKSFNGGESKNSSSCLIGIKYQYNLTDFIRIEPKIECALYHFCHVTYGYTFHELFNTIIKTDVFFYRYSIRYQRFRPYVSVAAGLCVLNVQEFTLLVDEYNYNYKGLYLQASLGLDYRLNRSFSMQIESGVNTCAKKYEYKGPYDLLSYGPFITAGITYNF